MVNISNESLGVCLCTLGTVFHAAFQVRERSIA